MRSSTSGPPGSWWVSNDRFLPTADLQLVDGWVSNQHRDQHSSPPLQRELGRSFSKGIAAQRSEIGTKERD